MTDYEVLISLGHTPLKAAQIVLEAKRDDKFSILWIAMARQQVAEKAVPPVANYDIPQK